LRRRTCSGTLWRASLAFPSTLSKVVEKTTFGNPCQISANSRSEQADPIGVEAEELLAGVIQLKARVGPQ